LTNQIHAPTTEYLHGISKRLKSLGYPIYFALPGPKVLEPFVVIGTHQEDGSKTAKFGMALEKMSLQIDIFLDGSSRTNAEDISYFAKALLNTKNITSDIREDTSIGRKTFHIVVKTNDYIF
jgi:hypothetical protein